MSAPFWFLMVLIVTPTASGAALIILLDHYMPTRPLLLAYALYLVGVIAGVTAGVLA